ncbi:hypothetical protein [Microtetraspora fusca]|uniref:hypothetical protein n=1 Tax=Microtetraspora fusca TaxID=1997 RepID=UPI000835FBBD|nr:hypothetical protein [Microtetraspora fusca]
MTYLDEFDEWLLLLDGEPEFDMDAGHLSEQARGALRGIYETHGFVTGGDLRSLILTRRATYATQALEKVNADLPALTAWQIRPEVLLEKSASSSGYLNVLVHGHEVDGLDPVGILAEVAAYLQADYIDEFLQVWPVCSRHRTGLHPLENGDSAVWRCKAGNHDVAEIGCLRTTHR